MLADYFYTYYKEIYDHISAAWKRFETTQVEYNYLFILLY